MEAFEIAVLIPHFNQRGDLEKSLESIRFSGKMAIVIVDDGSDLNQKPSNDWAEAAAEKIGHPVYLLLNEENKGIERTLNSGMEFILSSMNTKYIARLDCADINHPDRFHIQFLFMENNPTVWLVGSWADVVYKGRSLYTIRMPVTDKEIKEKMLNNNCFVHPTVMFRTLAVTDVGLYPEGYPAAEDYAYFFLFVKKYVTANIPKVLIHLPKSTSGISYRSRRNQLLSRLKVILHNFKFTKFSIWGLLRTSLFLVIPVAVVEYLKEVYDRPARY